MRCVTYMLVKKCWFALLFLFLILNLLKFGFVLFDNPFIELRHTTLLQNSLLDFDLDYAYWIAFLVFHTHSERSLERREVTLSLE